jgi:hypothetical protein
MPEAKGEGAKAFFHDARGKKRSAEGDHETRSAAPPPESALAETSGRE